MRKKLYLCRRNIEQYKKKRTTTRNSGQSINSGICPHFICNEGYLILPFEGLIDRMRQNKRMMDYTKQRFERLFKDSYPHMYRMAFSMVEDADDAKDAVNQVFTQMWKGKPKVSEESVRGYLLAATRNQCLHVLRQRQLQQQMEEELKRSAEKYSNEEREELLRELQQVIDDNLTEQDRRVLQLHYDEEMTYQETATVLGISTSAVNKHITRSLDKIRKTLKIAK